MPEIPQEEHPLAQLGLPPSWQPAPLACLLAKVGMNTPEGVTDLHLLVIDGPTGRQAFGFTETDLRKIANMILEQTSGLQLASAADLPGSPGLPEKWREFK